MMTSDEQDIIEGSSVDTLMTAAFQLTHRMHAARGTDREDEFRARRDLLVAEVKRRVYREVDTEDLARDLCDTYYLTVNTRPDMMMQDAYSKVSEKTRDHWRAHAALLIEKGWTR